MFILIDIISVIALLIMLVIYVPLVYSAHIRQKKCSHDGGVNETRACDAICKLCGKNLGFIGTEENKKRRSQ